MKEQVISARGQRRASAQPKGFVQRPARREGAPAARNFSLRAIFAYFPIALKIILSILVVVTLLVGYRMAASAALFQVRTIDVTGADRTSAEEIESLTRRAVMRTGVWRADLDAISRELAHLPGVRRAVVSRVLPDRLRVRVTERTPIAVVRNAAGHFEWVDEEGVTLGEMKTDDQMPAFFIRGWNEDGTEEGRKDNVERVQKYLELLHAWSAAGLSERVSEVTLLDIRDVRVQLAGRDAQIEVRLGSQDPGPRLKIALDALDVYRQTPRGSSITYVDLQTGRVVIGFSSGSKLASEPTASNSTNAESGDASTVAPRADESTNELAVKPEQRQTKPPAPKDQLPAGTGRFR